MAKQTQPTQKAGVPPRQVPEEPQEEDSTFYGVPLKTDSTRRSRQANPEDILGEPSKQEMTLPNGHTVEVVITPRRFQEKNKDGTIRKVSVGFSLSLTGNPNYYGYGQLIYKIQPR